MEYYVLSQKEEPGCPAGFLQADLYDKFYSDTKGVEHGFFPWYAEKIHYKTHTPYPEGMVLISKDKFYDFDIRSVARFYIVSDDFMSVCSDLGVGVTDAVAIQVVSKGGEKISSKKKKTSRENPLMRKKPLKEKQEQGKLPQITGRFKLLFLCLWEL